MRPKTWSRQQSGIGKIGKDNEVITNRTGSPLLGGLCFATALVLCLQVAAARPMTPQSPYTGRVRIKSKCLAKDFVPDGDLSKPAWRHASWVRFDHSMSGRRHFPQAKTAVASLWTPAFLYFAFRCHYTTLNVYEGEDPAKERWELWNRDVAEIFLNPQPERVNHYYEFEVAPNNQWIDLEIDKDKTPFNDASWNSGFEHATKVDAKRRVWTLEMRIPVEKMGATGIRPGMEWRLNLFRADGPGDDAARRFLAWSTIPQGKTFHVPVRFGIIRFVKQGRSVR